MKNKGYSKMVTILALILVTTTSLWFALPATPCYAQGYEETSVSGGGGGGIPSSYTYIEGKVDDSGIFTTDVTTETSDGLCQLTIETGTKALDKMGNPLVSILMIQDRYPPSSPPAGNIIGLVYDLLPYGATFDPPINMTFTYNPNALPAGVSEESLVIAYWKSGNSWVNLEGPFTIDVENNTISAPVSHFTDFTIIAYTNPAAFTASSLTISPTVINPGQDITIGVTATNTGDLVGSHELTLKIDDEVIATSEVTLAGHASEEITFFTTADYPVGDYEISVNGLSGTLTITEAPAPPAPAPPAPAPPAPAPPAPPTPALMLPEIDIKADAEVYFDWEDVTSLSPPITYRLQVASDKNFTSMVLEKEGLAKSEYTLTEEEKLAAVKKEAPYYWRVKAIDGAANDSGWSTPGSFYVGFHFALPGWAIYILIVLGVLVIGFFAFLVGRRTAYFQQ